MNDTESGVGAPLATTLRIIRAAEILRARGAEPQRAFGVVLGEGNVPLTPCSRWDANAGTCEPQERCLVEP